MTITNIYMESVLGQQHLSRGSFVCDFDRLLSERVDK